MYIAAAVFLCTATGEDNAPQHSFTKLSEARLGASCAVVIVVVCVLLMMGDFCMCSSGVRCLVSCACPLSKYGPPFRVQIRGHALPPCMIRRDSPAKTAVKPCATLRFQLVGGFVCVCFLVWAPTRGPLMWVETRTYRGFCRDGFYWQALSLKNKKNEKNKKIFSKTNLWPALLYPPPPPSFAISYRGRLSSEFSSVVTRPQS